MRVVLSRSASEFLKKETIYLRLKNPSAAARFIAQIREAKKNMQRFPDIGKEQSRLPIPGAKTWVTGNYLLDYTRDAESIVIVTIRHGKMGDPLTPDNETDDDLGT